MISDLCVVSVIVFNIWGRFSGSVKFGEGERGLFGRVGFRGMRVDLWYPFVYDVRRPPPLLVCSLCREFRVFGNRFFKVMQVGGVVSFWLFEVLLSGESCIFSGFGERVARPCVTRVRLMFLERCPASALRCVGPGPLGDASGSLSLVLASVNVNSVCISCCILLTLCVAVVR
jgi:hypothetical protein